MAYVIDSPLRGPEELGEAGGVPADWHVDFVDKSHKPYSHYIVIQFGSVGVDRAEAERIVQGILDGLNAL